MVRQMADEIAANRAVQRASKTLALLDRKLARARLRSDVAAARERQAVAESEAADSALDGVRRERGAAAQALAAAQAELGSPEPEPRRLFTRSEIAAAQARGRY